MKQCLIALAIAIALAACGGPEQPLVEHEELSAAFESLPPDTNILFVSFDALRTDVLGAYGSEKDLSPNIDRWSERGFVFDQFNVAGQATPTSFAAAFAGQYPFRVFRGWSVTETQTLAKVMKRSGRATFGIFHNVQLVDERNFGQGFDDYVVLNSEPEEHIITKSDELLQQNAGQPFFGWVHFISPHAPYERRDMANHLYSSDYEGPYTQTSGPRPSPDNEADARRVKELYDGEVFYLDSLFQEILDLLERLDLKDNTIVVLTSDHGEAFGEHGDYGHHTLYQEVIRVPLIIRTPGYEGGQFLIETPHMNTDFLPTLAGFTKAEYVKMGDGVDMLSPHDPRRPLILTAMTEKQGYSIAIRRGNDKLIVDCPPQEFREQLFDLAEDPGETNDRILDYPQKAGELFELMKTEVGGDPCDMVLGAVQGADIRDDLDEETIEKLKSLGYIQ
jgi:arylsulfatase A-like enzyme